MITINYYSGYWQAAGRPFAPRAGTTVRVHWSPDAREWDDFRRVLVGAGLRLASSPHKAFPRLKMDLYRIERGEWQ